LTLAQNEESERMIKVSVGEQNAFYTRASQAI
jgi:hypothetical protein